MASAQADGKKRHRHEPRVADVGINYSTYINKLLRGDKERGHAGIHADIGISASAMHQIQSLIGYFAKRTMQAVNSLLRVTGKHTVSSREIQTAVRLILPPDLAKHANSEAVKAVTKYNAGDKGSKKRPNERAGLIFAISRTGHLIRLLGTSPSSYGGRVRVGEGAPIYFAAVLEALAAEILDLAGKTAKDYKKHRINSRHVFLALRNDEELNRLFPEEQVFVSGGVLPNIHASLMPKTKANKGSE